MPLVASDRPPAAPPTPPDRRALAPATRTLDSEQTPTVLHVAARSRDPRGHTYVGDHSDVMATRASGWALLSSATPQEAVDLALIAQAAAIEAGVPFIHFFDGVISTRERMRPEPFLPCDLRALADDRLALACPVMGEAGHLPDRVRPTRDTASAAYLRCPGVVQRAMDRFALLTGRQYHLFEYAGSPDAERVLVLMGAGAAAAQESVLRLCAQGEKVGVLTVRLYRPFAAERFLRALPPTVASIAVLDRTREPGVTGEPLYLDVMSALVEGMANGVAPFASYPYIVGGRYGLSPDGFTPAMAEAVFDNLAQPSPRNHFTVGMATDGNSSALEVPAAPLASRAA